MLDFPSNSELDAPFYCIAYDWDRVDWDGIRDHLKDVPWEDIFKLSFSTGGGEFCDSFRLELSSDWNWCIYLTHINL